MGTIQLSGVGRSFKSTAAVSDIDLIIEDGGFVVLLGPSGCGKTTLMRTVVGVQRYSGQLEVLGYAPGAAAVRGRVGYVTQDAHMFHETILTNMRYARPDATVAQLDEACRGARILDVIRALPDGYDTVVGERGYRLSGGEKQRLAAQVTERRQQRLGQ